MNPELKSISEAYIGMLTEATHPDVRKMQTVRDAHYSELSLSDPYTRSERWAKEKEATIKDLDAKIKAHPSNAAKIAENIEQVDEAKTPFEIGDSHGYNNTDRVVRQYALSKFKEGTPEHADYLKGVETGNKRRTSIGRQYKA